MITTIELIDWLNAESKLESGDGSPIAASYLREAAQRLREQQYTSLGSVKGRVEKYNSHGDAKNFHIFPAIGGRIKCVFNEDQKELTGEFVNKNATVHGLLKYREGDFFPYEVIVHSMEKIDSDENLQTLSSLFGSSPLATGSQDSVEFIKSTRNGAHF